MPHELVDAEGRLRVHLPCAQCSYDLLGLQLETTCPECGCAIGGAAALQRMHLASPVWVMRLYVGSFWVMLGSAGALLATLGFPVVVALAWFSGTPLGNMNSGVLLTMALLTSALVATIGLLQLATPEQFHAGTSWTWAGLSERPDRARLLTRILMPLGVVLLSVWVLVLFMQRHTTPLWVRAIGDVFPILGCCAWWAGCVMGTNWCSLLGSRFAVERLPHRLRWNYHLWLWAGGVLLFPLLLMLSIDLPHLVDSWSSGMKLFVLILLGMLLLALWGLLLVSALSGLWLMLALRPIVRFQRALRRQVMGPMHNLLRAAQQAQRQRDQLP